MEPELAKRLEAMEQKLDATYRSAEKTRKYIFWTVVVTTALFVIPLLLLPFAVTSLFNTYSTALNF